MINRLPNKFFLTLLATYVSVQFLSLIAHHLWIYVTYELLFIALTIQGIMSSVKYINQLNSLAEMKLQVVWVIVSGVLLTGLYFLALINEPNFNITESPTLDNRASLLLYFPMIQAFFASTIIASASALAKLFRNKK